MKKLTSERKLVQSIIDNKGYCVHINCHGGDKRPQPWATLPSPVNHWEYSNIGVACPLRDTCKDIYDTLNNDIYLEMARNWMKDYKKNLKNKNSES